MATAPRKLSKKGLEFIAGFEGFRGQPYNDAAGHATIGFGHLMHYGKVTKLEAARYHKRPMTRAEGLALLRKDVVRYEKAVNGLVKVPLTQGQFDALVSFTFNLGAGALSESTLLKLLNDEKREQAADQFLRWNKAGGRVLEGLTRRRKAERTMFLTSIRKPTPAPGKYGKGPSAHFTWAEVHRGRKPFTTRDRLNAIKHARNLEKLRAGVNKARAKRGLKPTSLNILSWFRPKWYNDKIGGALKSQHLYALATDIDLREIDRLMPWRGGRAEFDRLCNSIFANEGFGQYPGGSRHVDSRGWFARWTSWGR